MDHGQCGECGRGLKASRLDNVQSTDVGIELKSNAHLLRMSFDQQGELSSVRNAIVRHVNAAVQWGVYIQRRLKHANLFSTDFSRHYTSIPQQG